MPAPTRSGAYLHLCASGLSVSTSLVQRAYLADGVLPVPPIRARFALACAQMLAYQVRPAHACHPPLQMPWHAQLYLSRCPAHWGTMLCVLRRTASFQTGRSCACITLLSRPQRTS